ncbi:hypothetical protein Xbed_02537 [Xenorhabdus beddingii]|uniref:Uncharacterized protein n=1 Tax=Xenorhabdus beddingii TaxID=40578 RepID=A0A1Y2SNN7_9GAMM|nr:hypothetical protein Xbed_02537 [Xenorhabdus beddingii]
MLVVVIFQFWSTSRIYKYFMRHKLNHKNKLQKNHQ